MSIIGLATYLNYLSANYLLTQFLFRLFAAGIKKCPKHVPLYQGWASLELRANNLTVARRLITEALTRDKRQGTGWLVAAQIEERQGNDGLVGLVLRRGIECAPHDAELYRALGEYLVGKGNIEDVRRLEILIGL